MLTDSNRGKYQLGGITPDGYTVDETGAWDEMGSIIDVESNIIS